ncbi:heavy metal translocating P-type ATPase [Facklamia miroungae]|uniref:Cd2+/Zn2+-exporting ATPase n=1 Tax=Facklamia miroungae TaxID=120956 RepID=A0A1G7PAY3_9LACT|nr:heavy metal translocating P-type ATPase [Facklamia miroungae]NKZ28643.1 heavy metal translocating P-type ATPase [Facklamia miroungae]SDF83384.1 Cd2+/Zn2+-exporting ATPase [Facklamia miroungae]
MLGEIFKRRKGQFFAIGSVLMILGFLLSFNPFLSRITFYFSIFFLAFYATKEAISETFMNKKLNVDLLMVLAALGAVIINYESEGAMLLFIFAGAEVLEEYATSKSTKAIEELMGHVPNVALKVMPNGETKEVSTDSLVVGDQVLVAKGDALPIDGFSDREVIINEAALTGESLPVEKKVGEEVFAGTINEGDSFKLEVSKLSKDTVFSSIIRMVEEAQSNPSKVASFIDRFESRYAMGVLLAVPLFIIGLYYLADYNFQEAFYRGMVLLTVASPCALVASATPATLSAISNGAKNGILVKGGAAMESLNTMEVLFSDKTGTLTQGIFDVVDYQLDEEYLKEVVYMEQGSNHPIALAIVKHFAELDLSRVNHDEKVEELPGQGMKKGDIQVGKPSTFEKLNNYRQYREQTKEGNTTIFIANKDQVLGYISLADQIREESIEAVKNFQEAGVEVVLVTGDNQQVAEKVAREVGISNVVAECLPEDKINYVKERQQQDKVVGMIGDGINDAPALANANIGIAMGSGSSIAMESSEIIVVKNNLLKLFYSYQLSHKLNRIIKQNIIFAISVILILIVLNLLGILDLPLGVVFHEGSTILVILNGLRLLKQANS